MRGRGSSRRAACIASVEPPETTWPVAENLCGGADKGERIDAGMVPEAPVLDRDQQIGEQRGRGADTEAPDAAGGGKQRERPVLAVEDLGARDTEAGEVGREGVIQRRAEGGEQKEKRRQEAEKCTPGRAKSTCRTQEPKELPLPLREGVGGRGPPGWPGPLPPTPSRKGRGSISACVSVCILTRSIGQAGLTPRPRA